MSKKVIILLVGIVVVLVIGGAAAVVVAPSEEEETQNSASTTHDEGHEDQRDTNTQQSSTSTDAASETGASVNVEIKDFAYAPATITVKVGTTVTWTNKDTARHDVVADSPSSDAPSSELLSKGQSYSFTFKKAGSYSYHCTPHPNMKATVIVEE